MYRITSRYLEKESFRSHGHLGIDFSMPDHTPLRSIQSGEVLRVVDYGKENIGKGVFVQWEDGKTAIYGHMSQTAVHPGDHVDVGTLLGYSGNSGHVVGAGGGYHLHFGLKEGGKFIDPSSHIDQIQNMNHPDTLRMLAEQVPHHTEHIVQTGYSLADLFNGQLQTYTDFLSSFKMNCIHFLSSIDYTMFIQHIQHLFQLFF